MNKDKCGRFSTTSNKCAECSQNNEFYVDLTSNDCVARNATNKDEFCDVYHYTADHCQLCNDNYVGITTNGIITKCWPKIDNCAQYHPDVMNSCLSCEDTYIWVLSNNVHVC